MNMVKCPKCGSKNLIPILYGMPAWSGELERKLREKKVILEGCCIRGCEPKYRCGGCGKKVGTPPVVNKKALPEAEDYRDAVEEVRFLDGGCFGGYKEVKLKKRGDGTHTLHVSHDMVFPTEGYERELSRREWEDVLEKLYGRLFLHEWRKRYVDPFILDGEQWELELRLSGNRKRSYCGDNAFPPLWKELTEVFAPFFGEGKRNPGIRNGGKEGGIA